MKNKNYSISLIRMLATILVVMCHITQHYQFILSDWFNVGVQYFFCISAFLYSQKKINRFGKWFKRKYIELLIPISIWVIFFRIILRIISIEEPLSVSLKYMFGLGGFTSETSYFMVLWFITYILFCYCMIPILQKINIEKEKNDIKFIGKLIILLLIVFIILELISFIGLPSLSMAHVSCFIIPYYVSKRFDILSIKFNEANNKLLILILLLNIFIALMRYGFVSILPPAVIELLYLYSHTLLGVSTFYVLINIIDKVISFNNSLVNLVNISDKYSLSIYIVHSVFVGFSTSLISYFGNGIIGIIIALTVTLIISYVLTNISSKILNKVLIMM